MGRLTPIAVARRREEGAGAGNGRHCGNEWRQRGDMAAGRAQQAMQLANGMIERYRRCGISAAGTAREAKREAGRAVAGRYHLRAEQSGNEEIEDECIGCRPAD